MKNYLAVFAALLCCAVQVQSQTPFTYQGRLTSSNGAPASGNYDLTFRLFSVPAGGSPVSATVSNEAVNVSVDGLFSTTLDFGANIFDGNARWLEIAVRTNGSGAFSTLVPRQLITAAPYAIYASNAANASLLGGVSATGFASNTHTHAASQITSGTLSAARGGTGADTSAAANGSILRANGAGAWTAYGPGGNNAVLKMVGGTPQWSTDADTTYLAGNGLQLSGTTFSVNFVGSGISNSVARSDHTHSGADITSGSIPDARISNNIPRLNANNTFSGSNIFSGVVIATNQSNQISGAFTGNAAGLTNINGANIAAGSITSNALAANSVTAAKIAPGTLNHLDAPDGSPINALLVNTNGLIGVGTNDPHAGLHVASSAAELTLARTYQTINNLGIYTNLGNPRSVATFGTLTAIASSIEGGVTIFEVFNGSPIFRSQIRDSDGVFTNFAGANGVALRSNLLAVAAATDDAVTLISLTNPAAPVKLAELKDGVNSWNDLNGARRIAISGNIMAISAQSDNAVTLADISNPSAPVQLAVIRDGSFGYTNVAGPRGLAISGNLLAIAAETDHTVTLADISNPSNPVKLAELNPSTGFLYTEFAYDVAFSGSVLGFVAAGDNAVTLVSVTNPAAPVLLSQTINNSENWLAGPVSLAMSSNRMVVACGYTIALFDIANPSVPSFVGGARNGINRFNYMDGANGVAFAGTNIVVTVGNGDHGFTIAEVNRAPVGLTSAGWVGIGTALPMAALDVSGDIVGHDAGLVSFGTLGFEAGADVAALGNFSAAFGIGAEARGNYSAAFGHSCITTGAYAFAFGLLTEALGQYSLAGGNRSRAFGHGAVALGSNTVAEGNSSFAFGTSCRASNDFAVALGFSSTADGLGSTAFGYQSRALGQASVAGGSSSVASGQYSVALGFSSTATSNGAVALGYNNDAVEMYAFAIGYNANANHVGSFVWADNAAGSLSSTNANSVTMRAVGGYRLISNSGSTAGVYLAPGGTSWGSLSDRSAKKNFRGVNEREVLQKILRLPIQRWNYQWEQDNDVPHIGPMAQDFKAAFYPGRDDKTITTLEFDGVELAAIQALTKIVGQQEIELKAKSDRIEKLEKDVAELKALVSQVVAAKAAKK